MGFITFISIQALGQSSAKPKKEGGAKICVSDQCIKDLAKKQVTDLTKIVSISRKKGAIEVKYLAEVNMDSSIAYDGLREKYGSDEYKYTISTKLTGKLILDSSAQLLSDKKDTVRSYYAMACGYKDGDFKSFKDVKAIVGIDDVSYDCRDTLELLDQPFGKWAATVDDPKGVFMCDRVADYVDGGYEYRFAHIYYEGVGYWVAVFGSLKTHESEPGKGAYTSNHYGVMMVQKPHKL
jgi:hypothetical protein